MLWFADWPPSLEIHLSISRSERKPQRPKFPAYVTSSSVGKVVITVAYGESVYNERGKELIQLNTEASDLVTYAISNGWLVDIVPFSKLYALS
jgi:hypothetical protein